MRYIASFVFVIGLFISLPQVTQASFTTNDFITTWDTENTGTSASNQITIPGTGAGYSYSIYWESLSSTTATGTIATSTSASQTITFPEPGEYKVAIKGTYPRISFNNSGDKLKILTVEQWGNIAWTSMDSAFYGCANLTVPATDAPDLSGVTQMFLMFAYATPFNESINHWDVSNITGMDGLFLGTNFNQPLDQWNTSNVTSMLNVFNSTSNFNQPLNNWDVSKVTSFRAMFSNALNFNQPLDQWNTASGTDMTNMFWNSPFNQDISMWNVSNVQQMQQMFRGNTIFNQPLNSWDVSNVTLMRSMFSEASSFNQPLNNWNVSNVTEFGLCSADSEIRGMFYRTNFNQDLSSWNISSTTCMKNFFLDTEVSTANLDSTLTSWAGQSLHSNVPFHLGLKTYSSTGQTALDTLRDTYNWTITEQYQAEYQEGDDYTLSGTTIQSPINLSGTTTAVEVIPDERCEFINWSDNNTQNPRTDTLTDNLTVSANVECRNPSTGTSAKGRADKLEALGNQAKAEAVKEKYLNTTPANPATTPTLETAIINIKNLTNNHAIINNPESRQRLISILQQLVQILRGMAGESN